MGFCHQKDLFRIESKPAFICQFQATRKESFVLYFMKKKMWRATVDNRGPWKRHGPPSRETIHAFRIKDRRLRESISWIQNQHSESNKGSWCRMVWSRREKYGGLSKGQLRIVKDPVNGFSRVESTTLRYEIFIPQVKSWRCGQVLDHTT